MKKTNQKEYFKQLTKVTHPENLKVAVVKYNSKTDSYTPGIRYNSEKYEVHDERNIAVNEVVFDFDWSSYKANYQRAKLVVEALENRKIPFIICATGGKGIHIHSFFNKLTFTTPKGKELFKTALSHYFNYKHLRLWFWNTILEEAGIEEKYRNKQIDPKVLKFNYYAGTTHLIRDIGGRKHYKNNEGEFEANYKTWIPREEFKSIKPRINNISNVQYPDKILTFNIDEEELCSYLTNYNDLQSKSEVKQLTNERIKGNYVDLDGVLKIREGLNEGNRSSGASIIAIAARIDNLGKKEAYDLIEEYADSCSQLGSRFTKEEGEQWVDWIYNHDKPYWNCQLLEDIGVHERELCEHCQLQNKEAIEFLTQTTMLKQIKEVLDMEIVGEDDIKILIFLLSLSKNFPSKTGKPGWNLPQDPMSQNIILSCDSASGKTWMTKKVIQLFGDEDQDYFVVSRITKNAINYYTDINMDGKIIFIEELQGMDENTSQLRVWMSEGKLNLQTVEKVMNEEGQEVNTLVKKTTTGQPTFITNQAEGVVEDQLNNRSWVLSLDASESQTAKILDYQDNMTKGKQKIDGLKIRKIKDALQQLKPYHFIISFADRKAMSIPIKDVRSRRDYEKFLTLIKCSAYLHQHQRLISVDEDGNEFINCDIKDYDIAREYSSNVLGATFSGLTNAQIDLINYLKRCSWSNEFQISDVMRNLGKSQPHWYGLLKQLANLGFVSCEKELGNSTIYTLIQSKALNIINLPSGEELLKKIDSTYKQSSEEQKVAKSSKHSVPAQQLIGATEIRAQKTETHLLQNENDGLDKRSNPTQNVSQKVSSLLFIGAINRNDVINYFKKTNKHLVKFVDIKERFGCSDKDLEKVLDYLKSESFVMEAKPGLYILL